MGNFAIHLVRVFLQPGTVTGKKHRGSELEHVERKPGFNSSQLLKLRWRGLKGLRELQQ